MEKVNRTYKDRLFRMIFGKAEMKENILDLYNSLNNSSYTNADDIDICTLEDSVYMSMKNDVAFVFDSYLSAWEQQSTYNPNMPIRGLMYFGKMYNRYIESNNLNIYSTKLEKLPTPRYVVFYNGLNEKPAIEKLKLSDSFINPSYDGEFEWTATLYNLNKGKNEDLLRKCKPLSDYMEFINRVRDFTKEFDLTTAISLAVDSCIKDGILADFLKNNKAEVTDMVLTEYNEERVMQGMYEDGMDVGLARGRSEGIAIGKAEGIDKIKKAIFNLMQNTGKTFDEACEMLGIPEGDRDELRQE